MPGSGGLWWQQPSLVLAVHHCLALSVRIPRTQDRIELARYAHLPLGNLGGDWMLDVADAHLARCLRDAGHLLWVSDPGLPDVAGRADDDAEEDLLLSEPAPLEVRQGFCLVSGVGAGQIGRGRRDLHLPVCKRRDHS